MKLIHIVFARRAALVLPFCMALGGCLSSSPIWDAHVGDAVRTVAKAQIIDPHAGEHTPSTPGIDGQAAVSAQDAYDKSFRLPDPAPNAFVIGVGSAGGNK
jgi:hypothetical protein